MAPTSNLPTHLLLEPQQDTSGSRSRASTFSDVTFTLDGVMPSFERTDSGSTYYSTQQHEREPLLHASPLKPSINGESKNIESKMLGFEPCESAPGWMGPLLFLCGVSVFSRTEAIFLQQLFFGGCLGFGDTFYAGATAALFVPGIAVHMLQSRYDGTWNDKYGLSATILFRLAISTIVSIGIIVVIVALAEEKASLFPNYYLLYGLLTTIGLSTSVAFGTLTRLVSLFPTSTQSWFFIGTFCPFLIFAPVNIGIGDICVPDSSNMKNFDINWKSVWVFYGVASTIILVGFLACIAVIFSDFGAEYLRHVSIHNEEATLMNTSTPMGAIFKKQQLSCIAMGLGTLSSTVAAAFYICFRVTKFMDLSTLLIYEYYICASLGIMLSSWKPAIAVLSDQMIGVLSIARCPCVFLAVYYARFPDVYHNDFMALGINAVFMITGGIIYQRSFAQSSSKFVSREDRMAAASVMSAVYYLSIIVGIAISFGLHLTLPKQLPHS